MDLHQLQENPQQFFTQAIQERLKQNDNQVKTWTEYRKRHEKIIEGLEILPQHVSMNCMVPLGKRAMIKGKLTHTNEITVSLGDGYFAKYTAVQAIALCHRRIKKANEMLEYLKQERNLYDMRQMIPDAFDIFGSGNKKDFNEHWDDKKLEDWRAQHRQREKEYRKKLAEIRSEQKQEVESEEDLFKKLDALELEEELEDELNRLEDERSNFYGQSSEDQYVDESEVDSESYSSDYSEEAINEVPERKLSKVNHRLQVLNSVNSSESNASLSSLKTELSPSESVLRENDETNDSKNNEIKCPTSELKSSDHNGGLNQVDKLKIKEKKVAFAEPQVKYFSNEEELESSTERRRVSVIEQRLYEYSKEDDESEDESDEDETIRIHFKHSDSELNLPVNTSEITSPKDIYTFIPGPKSILKKTTDVNYIKQSSMSSDMTTEEETDDETPQISAYNTVVKEIQEHLPNAPVAIEPTEEQILSNRPMSKFKLSRAGLKK